MTAPFATPSLFPAAPSRSFSLCLLRFIALAGPFLRPRSPPLPARHNASGEKNAHSSAPRLLFPPPPPPPRRHSNVQRRHGARGDALQEHPDAAAVRQRGVRRVHAGARARAWMCGCVRMGCGGGAARGERCSALGWWWFGVGVGPCAGVGRIRSQGETRCCLPPAFTGAPVRLRSSLFSASAQLQNQPQTSNPACMRRASEPALNLAPLSSFRVRPPTAAGVRCGPDRGGGGQGVRCAFHPTATPLAHPTPPQLPGSLRNIHSSQL